MGAGRGVLGLDSIGEFRTTTGGDVRLGWWRPPVQAQSVIEWDLVIGIIYDLTRATWFNM